MTNIRKILFATDFSETSQAALDMTNYLKNALGSEVHVVHVFDPKAFEMPAPYYFMPGVDKWLDEHFSGVKARGRTALDDLCPSLAECHSHFLEGTPGQTIVNFAHKNEIDLIIMGTHGHRGLDHLVLGSVAAYVTRHAKCPVMTVKS